MPFSTSLQLRRAYPTLPNLYTSTEVIRQLQQPEWVNRVFFARFDSQATWIDELEPAFDDREFFFEPSIRAMYDGRWKPEWARTDDDDEQLSA